MKHKLNKILADLSKNRMNQFIEITIVVQINQIFIYLALKKYFKF